MQDTFDFNRFGKYFVYDLTHSYSRYGLSLLIFGLLPVLIYLAWVLSALIFGHSAPQSVPFFRALSFLIIFAVSISFGARVYGMMTERKSATDWISLPASALEKTVSLLLVTCVVLPVLLLALLALSNAFVSLFIAGFGPVLPFSEDWMESRGLLDLGDFAAVNGGLFFWLNWVGTVLTFTLGALCFKRNKIGLTFLVLVGVFFLLSGLAALFFHVTEFDGEMFRRFLSDFDETRAQTWINVTLNLFYAVAIGGLVAGLWGRIKTLKA
ncbi:MAG: hypothetical protein IJ654_04865 [Bacteroidales bacterium]|nr:hypothetical protein [Bacteroidales bacterium]